MNQKKPICTIAVAGINVVVFLVLSFIGNPESGTFMLGYGAMYVPYVLEGGEYYRLFTSLFLHFGIAHLVNNMLLLILLGQILEKETGHIKFLLIYLLSGLGGNVLSAAMDIRSGEFSVSAGASGAVFGLIGALIFVALLNHGSVGNVSSRGMVFMAILSLYFGFTSEGVDNLAHVGGLVCGALAAVLLYRKKHGNSGSTSRR